MSMNQPTLAKQHTPAIYADLEALYRPQRVWAEGRGVLLVAAHFLSGVGAGGWLMGLLLGSRTVLLLGLLATVIGGLVHLGFLGHPERAWQMIRKPRTSWISRGLLAIGIFVPSALLYLIPQYAPSAYGTRGAFAIVMLVISLAGMAGIFLYKGFVYSASRAVPLWHSPLLPVSYIAVGLRSGAALALICLPFAFYSGGFHAASTWWIATTIACLFLFLVEASADQGDQTVARSLRVLWRGQMAWTFWVGWIVIGVLVPAGLVIASFPEALSSGGYVIAGVASLFGDFCYKYCFNTAGTYVPFVSAGKAG
jgi:formate-dependent nitrite reductase membrane component NrfD